MQKMYLAVLKLHRCLGAQRIIETFSVRFLALRDVIIVVLILFVIFSFFNLALC